VKGGWTDWIDVSQSVTSPLGVFRKGLRTALLAFDFLLGTTTGGCPGFGCGEGFEDMRGGQGRRGESGRWERVRRPRNGARRGRRRRPWALAGLAARSSENTNACVSRPACSFKSAGSSRGSAADVSLTTKTGLIFGRAFDRNDGMHEGKARVRELFIALAPVFMASHSGS
jgi:hypothetical protein